jgi:hypothetical protein
MYKSRTDFHSYLKLKHEHQLRDAEVKICLHANVVPSFIRTDSAFPCVGCITRILMSLYFQIKAEDLEKSWQKFKMSILHTSVFPDELKSYFLLFMELKSSQLHSIRSNPQPVEFNPHLHILSSIFSIISLSMPCLQNGVLYQD